jgi:hypothetical protein
VAVLHERYARVLAVYDYYASLTSGGDPLVMHIGAPRIQDYNIMYIP